MPVTSSLPVTSKVSWGYGVTFRHGCILHTLPHGLAVPGRLLRGLVVLGRGLVTQRRARALGALDAHRHRTRQRVERRQARARPALGTQARRRAFRAHSSQTRALRAQPKKHIM